MDKFILKGLMLFLLPVQLFAQTAEEQIHNLLDGWHHAAAVADGETFFGSMTADARYIGTDETENWERDELKQWSKAFFDRGSAWDFKKKTRNLYLHTDGQIAWFDETLDTWMGVCRGSGVVVQTENGWKIQHYVLSVAVPNEKIDAYLELD